MSIIEYFTDKRSWYCKKLDIDKSYITQALDYGLTQGNIDLIEKTLAIDSNAVITYIKPKLNNYFKTYFNILKSVSDTTRRDNIILLDKLLTCLLKYDNTIGTAIILPSCDTVHEMIGSASTYSVIINIVNILESIGYYFDNYDKNGLNFIGKITNLNVIFPDRLFDKLDFLIDINKPCDITTGDDILMHLVDMARIIAKSLNNDTGSKIEPCNKQFNMKILTYFYQLIKRYVGKVDVNHRNYNKKNALEYCHVTTTKNICDNSVFKDIVKLLIQHGYTLSAPGGLLTLPTSIKKMDDSPNFFDKGQGFTSGNIKKINDLLNVPSILRCNWKHYDIFTFYLDCGYDFTTPAYLDCDKSWLDAIFEYKQNIGNTNFINSKLYNLLINNNVKHDDKYTHLYLTKILDHGLSRNNIDTIVKALTVDMDGAMTHLKVKLFECLDSPPKTINLNNIMFFNDLLIRLRGQGLNINFSDLFDCDTVHNIISRSDISAIIFNVVNILETIGYDFNNYDKEGVNFFVRMIRRGIDFPDTLFDKLDTLIDHSKLCDITTGANIMCLLAAATCTIANGLSEGKYKVSMVTYYVNLVKRYVGKIDIRHRNYNGRNALEICQTVTKNNIDAHKDMVRLLIQHGYTLSSPTNGKKPSVFNAKWPVMDTFKYYLECGYDFTTSAYLDSEKTWLDLLFEHYENSKTVKFIKTDLYKTLIYNGAKHDAKWYKSDPLLERLFRQYKVGYEDCDICAVEENVFFDKFGHKMCLSCVKQLKKCQQCLTVY